ncbi:MAG: TetR/AcrR family transcriptional regulator [Anaerolineae bacterium]|nr:TetR/AcrR family transcriptional regulator [Anaerolineae bacterium]
MMMQTPRQRRYFKTKATILQAAQEIITEKGLDGLSLRELARRIDYSPSGLYEYFNSKDEIVAAIRAEGLELMRDYLKRVPADLSPAERLVQMGLAYLEFAQDHPEHFRLIFSHLTASRNSFNDKLDEGSPYHLLLQAVRAVIEAEELTLGEEYSLQEIAYSFWSLVHGMAMLRQTHLRHFKADFEGIHRRTLRIFAEGLKNKQLSAV